VAPGAVPEPELSVRVCGPGISDGKGVLDGGSLCPIEDAVLPPWRVAGVWVRGALGGAIELVSPTTGSELLLSVSVPGVLDGEGEIDDGSLLPLADAVGPPSPY
jgi:hypothetical protein